MSIKGTILIKVECKKCNESFGYNHFIRSEIDTEAVESFLESNQHYICDRCRLVCDKCGTKSDGEQFHCGDSIRCRNCWCKDLIEHKISQIEILESEINSLKEQVEDKAL